MSEAMWGNEAYDAEADEAYFDAEELGEDYGEDFGEASRSRSRRRRRDQKHMRTQGVGGLSVRGTEGQVHQVPFPQKLATARETNRAFAALSGDLDHLEARLAAQKKRESAITSFVSLGIDVPLTILSIMQTNETRHKGTETGASAKTFLKEWSEKTSTKVAATTSAAQLLTTGATLTLDRRYSQSKIALAADIFAAGQLLTFFCAHVSLK